MAESWLVAGRAGGEDEPGAVASLAELAARACERAVGRLAAVGRPAAAWVVIGPGRARPAGRDALEGAVDLCQRELAAAGAERVVATTASGYLDARGDGQARPFVAVVLLGSPTVELACVREATAEPGVTGATLAQRLAGGEVSPSALVLATIDTSRLLLEPEVAALDRGLDGPLLLGGVAAPARGGAGRVWVGDGEWRGEVVAAALALGGSRPPDWRTLGGHRSLCEPLEVTRTRGPWIERLAGRPALRALGELAGGALLSDPGRACRSLKLELTDARGSARVYNLTGVDPARGALSVAGLSPVPGAWLRVLQRDAELAREELRALRGEGHGGGLYVACASRGAALFAHEGVESGALAASLGTTPLAGWYTPAPFGGAPARVLSGSALAVLLN